MMHGQQNVKKDRNVTLRRVRATIVALEGQQVLHRLSVCFLAFVTQHAMRNSHIVICGLSGSTVFFHITS